MDEKIFLTKEKLEELKTELKNLVTIRRGEIAEQLQYAKGLGDLSENAEYHEARDEQAKVEARISQLEHVLKNAEVFHHKKGDVVEIGSEVEFQKKGEKEIKKVKIVSSEETDAVNGKISNESPIGLALIGKKKGESFEMETPKGKIEFKIKSVE